MATTLLSSEHPRVLAPEEIGRLKLLEETIRAGIKTFIQVGLALAEIRDSRLYRSTHATFESYCKERWGFTRQRAYQLIGAAEVAGTLECKPGVDIPEKALRLLRPIPAEERQKVYNRAVEIAGDRPVVTSDIAAVTIPATANDDEIPARSKSYLKSRKREDKHSRAVEVMVSTVATMAEVAESIALDEVDPQYRRVWAMEMDMAARALVRFAEQLAKAAEASVVTTYRGRRVLEVDQYGPVVVAKAARQ